MNRRPEDWPLLTGPISLEQHDRPHASSTIEWWYVNSHLTTDAGEPLSLFAAFFRILQRTEKSGEKVYAHSLTWALSDARTGEYLAQSRVDASAPKIGLEKIQKGFGSKDARINRAMQEVLEKGRVPRPDRVFEGPVRVAQDALDLDFDGCTFKRDAQGRYQLKLAGEKASAELTFTAKKPPIRHGDDGTVRGVHGEDMFYYFVPRCAVTGSISLPRGGASVRGDGWYDHEFGCPREQKERDAHQGEGRIAWNWLSAQLDDGAEVSVYELTDTKDGSSAGRWAIVIGADGARTAHSDFTLKASAPWRSVRTFQDYPTRFDLEVPGAKLSLTSTASFADQELVTVMSRPAFWEGRVELLGTRDGRAVRGLGYVERNGFCDLDTLDDFFSRVGEEVRKSVARVYPLELTQEHAAVLVGDKTRPDLIEDIDLPQLSRTLIAPLREIADRGGKSWRSYAALACCDIVEGDSRKFSEWLAMPELIHCGSLVVDDVEDRSTTRRGGPTAHLIYGEPLAINAGTAGYFMGERLLNRSLVSDAAKLRLYDLYFESMRAGHAGQAIDLDGLKPFVAAALKRGDVSDLERKVLAIHRLKTAAPAAALARMGAVAGGGSEAQIDAVGRYFEAVGLAFQIIDDVLNLKGFKGDLKSKGEDIAHAKVTIPFVKALALLGPDARATLARRWLAGPQDPKEIGELIAIVDQAGAFDACIADAKGMVEVAWKRLDAVVKDSLPKLMLRAFGWYILERHY